MTARSLPSALALAAFAAFTPFGACADSPPVLAPILDQPVNADASAFPLDDVTMEVAHNGSAMDLASATFTPGQTLELADIPFADDLVVYLTGYVGQDQVVAFGRTCAVAVTATAPIEQPHLYFSESVKFGQLVLTPPNARIGGAAVTYVDGSGLILGGTDSSTPPAPIADIEQFDPLTGELASIASLAPRFSAAISLLGSGAGEQVAVLGGLDPATNAGAQFVELVDPAEPSASRRVTTIEDAQTARIDLTATLLQDGSVVAIGGQPTSASPPSGEVDQIVLADGTATITELPATLTYPRMNHTATRLGDDVGAPVLIAGGVDSTGAAIGSAELFKPLAQAFSATFTATMIHPRSQHQAVEMPDGSVLIVGGIDGSGNPVTDLELFTEDGGFSLIGQLPPDAGILDFAATTLPDGRVLLTGGRLTPMGDPVDTAYIATLDPLGSPPIDLVATDNLITPRANHQATLLCDGTVILSGGTATAVPLERYNPPPDGRR